MYDKKEIDARPFVQIWDEMTDLERVGLKQKLMKGGISDDTILNWKKGKTRPVGPYLNTVVRTLRLGGINVTPETLFPKTRQ